MGKKKIMLFDVDGTIAESGQIMDKNIALLLHEIKCIEDIEYGIVGGGKFDKIFYQTKNQILMEHIFSECGSIYHKLDSSNNYFEIYKKDIRNVEYYHKINILVKYFLKFLSEVDYLLSGNFVDLRNGLIYLSLVGMYANEEERKNFLEKDKINHYRIRILESLQNEAKNLNIEDKIDILLGGSVGIAIYPKEWNKVQVIDKITLNEYKEIYYFGDKYDEQGNDYKILNHTDVIGVKVDSINDTIKYLEKYLLKVELEKLTSLFTNS